MIKHTFEDISSGGGFFHYWITFPKYNIGVLINKEDSGALPKEGDRFDIGVYKLEYDSNCDKSPSMGEHFENSFNTLDNFGHAQIVARALGYCEGLGLIKKENVIKKFLCVWNDDIFEVHDFASLYDNYKRTNLYEEQFAENYGSCIDAILDSLDLDEIIFFDNMKVTRLK